MKFANYKTEKNIFGRFGAFKEINFTLVQDYSAHVHLAHNKLVEYGRSQNTAFKLKFDNLLVGDKLFTCYVSTKSVVEIRKK